MGKVRNQRSRNNGNSLAVGAPNRGLLTLGNNNGVDISGLEANMGSLEENKRLQACQLIADISRLNGHSSRVMDKVTNKRILVKFVARLVDPSLRVKAAAFTALQILSSVSNVDVTNRLITSGIFQTALIVSTEAVDMSISEFVDIKQNALYSVANIISSQPKSVQEMIDRNAAFFEFLLSNIVPENNMSILNTCLNVLNIFSRSGQNDRLINQILGNSAIATVQQLMNAFLMGRTTIEPNTGTVLVTTPTLSMGDQDIWIVTIQCLEILSNFYVNSISSEGIHQQIDIRNVINLSVQLLGLAATGISTLPEESTGAVSRENDFIEMMSEFFSNLSTKVTAYIQGLEDEQGRLRQPTDRHLHIRLMFVGSLLSSARTPTFDTVSAFTSVWQRLQHRIRTQTMTAETYAQLRATSCAENGEDDDEIVLDDADPNMAVTNPSTADAAARTMPSNLMNANSVLTHEAVATMLVLEKAQVALGDLLALQTSLVMIPSEMPPLPTSPMMLWDTLFAHAAFLREALENITPSMDNASNKAVEGWMTADEEDLLPLKSTVISQSVTFFDIMTALISHSAALLPTSQCIWVIQEEQLRALVIILMQWLSAPQLEVCVSVLATIASFAKDQWCGSQSFPPALFGVMTNALVNRLRQSTCFSASSTRDGSDGSTKITLNKTQNVQRATILLLDAVFNGLIDLHSSDHATYHEVYQRMNLTAVFAQERDQLVQRVQGNIFLLSESEREQLEDTLANVDGLLEYKKNNFR